MEDDAVSVSPGFVSGDNDDVVVVERLIWPVDSGTVSLMNLDMEY